MKKIKFLLFVPAGVNHLHCCTSATNKLMGAGHEVTLMAPEDGLPDKTNPYFDVVVVHAAALIETKLAVYGLNRTVIVLSSESQRKPAIEVGPWQATPDNLLEVVADVCADFALVVMRSGRSMTSLSISEQPSS